MASCPVGRGRLQFTCGVLLLFLVFSEDAQPVGAKYKLVFNINGLYFGLRSRIEQEIEEILEPLMFELYLNPYENRIVGRLKSRYVSYQHSRKTPPVIMKYRSYNRTLQTTVQYYKILRNSFTSNDIYVYGVKLNPLPPSGDNRARSSRIRTTRSLKAAPSQRKSFKAVTPLNHVVHKNKNIMEYQGRIPGERNLVLVHDSMIREISPILPQSFKRLDSVLRSILPKVRLYHYAGPNHTWYTNDLHFPGTPQVLARLASLQQSQQQQRQQPQQQPE
eukprot:Lankesteria_metandrocarpae@DN4743_c1_g1_i1.p1